MRGNDLPVPVGDGAQPIPSSIPPGLVGGWGVHVSSEQWKDSAEESAHLFAREVTSKKRYIFSPGTIFLWFDDSAGTVKRGSLWLYPPHSTLTFHHHTPTVLRQYLYIHILRCDSKHFKLPLVFLPGKQTHEG